MKLRMELEEVIFRMMSDREKAAEKAFDDEVAAKIKPIDEDLWAAVEDAFSEATGIIIAEAFMAGYRVGRNPDLLILEEDAFEQLGQDLAESGHEEPAV